MMINLKTYNLEALVSILNAIDYLMKTKKFNCGELIGDNGKSEITLDLRSGQERHSN